MARSTPRPPPSNHSRSETSDDDDDDDDFEDAQAGGGGATRETASEPEDDSDDKGGEHVQALEDDTVTSLQADAAPVSPSARSKAAKLQAEPSPNKTTPATTSTTTASSPLQTKKAARAAKKAAKQLAAQGQASASGDATAAETSTSVQGLSRVSDEPNLESAPDADAIEMPADIDGAKANAEHATDTGDDSPRTPTALTSTAQQNSASAHLADDDDDQRRPFSLSSEPPDTPRSSASVSMSQFTPSSASGSASKRGKSRGAAGGARRPSGRGRTDSLASASARDPEQTGPRNFASSSSSTSAAGSPNGGGSVAAAAWRNSLAEAAAAGDARGMGQRMSSFMDDVSLSEGEDEDEDEDDDQERAREGWSEGARSAYTEVNGNGNGKSSTNGSGQTRRRSASASASGEDASDYGEEDDEEAADEERDIASERLDEYGFMKARLDRENSLASSDPLTAAQRRQSAAASSAAVIKEANERMQKAKLDAAAGTGTGRDEVDWDFWGRVMSNYEEVASTHPRELSRAIQRGIPSALRGMTWQLMAASKDLVLEEMYGELLKQPSPHEKSIGRDLNRTFPKHEYFMDAAGVGQQNLFNVVKAYSIYDEEVGYTQGLQFIVGPLLLNMPDEEAFCVLVRLMKSYDLRSHYTPNMPGLQLRLFQFDRLLEELLPGVFMHLLRQGIKSSMYASQWFLTLFGYRFPLELVSSVFDLVFAEGVEAIFRFSVAILKKNETRLCQLEFEDLIEYLKNGLFESYAPDPDDPSPHPLYKAHDFVREALQVKITPLMLDQFGEEWETLSRQQSAHTMELDALRKANLQLSLQVRQLEASLSQINTEHCELVKQVVMAKLEREELEDELVKYKIAYADISHQQASDGASLSRQSFSRSSGASLSMFGFGSSAAGNTTSGSNPDRMSGGSSGSPDLSRSIGSQSGGS